MLRQSFLQVWFIFGACLGRLLPPRTRSAEFIEDGDINLGFLVDIHQQGERDGDDICSGEPANDALVTAASIKFAVDEVNRRHDILPNITIGYVVKDACENDITALARSIFLVENNNPRCQGEDEWQHLRESHPYSWPVSRKVAGVIGHLTSRQSVMVAPLLGVFQTPFLGTMATSDELADKTRFEYFLNLLPPDTVTVKAMVDVLVHFNWTYVSVVYTDGSYGEYGFKSITKLAQRNGICIASASRIPTEATEDDYQNAVDVLNANHRARTVLLFGEFGALLEFFGFVNRKLTRLDKILLGGSSTCAYGHFPHVVDAINGLICVGYPSSHPPGFVEFYNNMRWEDKGVPWFKELWQHEFKCQDGENSELPCVNQTFTETEWSLSDFAPDKIYDGVYAFAYALEKVIEDSCHSGNLSKMHFDQCINGPELLEAIKKSHFLGLTSTIEFNEDSQVVAHYLVKQLVTKVDGGGRSLLNSVGIWDEVDADGGSLEMIGTLLPWGTYLANYSATNESSGIPESVCSLPCGPKQYRIRLEQACCWNCHDCNQNEILVNNKTGCERCSRYEWPDEETATVCEKVPPTFLSFGESAGNGLTTASGLGFVVSIGSFIIFILHRNTRLVKATSKHITGVILSGVTLACLVMLAFVSRPTRFICAVRYAGFHLSVNLIYGPLFVKTMRIYRIFASGKSGNRRPYFISNSWQIVFTTISVSIEMALLIGLMIAYPPDKKLHMPISTERYVEATCKTNLSSFLIPLVYNLLLIILCALMGFFVRKLPENFNESWFIFISVFTTLFTWVVLIPSYFMAVYSYYQSIILSLCLIINVYVTLFCQFFPKAYALYFIEPEKLNVELVTASKKSGTMNTLTSRVHPGTGSAESHTS